MNVSNAIPSVEPASRTMARRMWERLRFKTVKYSEADDGVRYLCEMFVELPSKSEYPDYYEVIHQPIDLMTIQRNIEVGKYDTGLQLLVKDVNLM